MNEKRKGIGDSGWCLTNQHDQCHYGPCPCQCHRHDNAE